MGSVFRFIHDDAMFPCGGAVCHFCETDTVPIYRYDGEIVHPDCAANPRLAREESEVSELCADCVLGDHVKKDIDPVIEKTVNRFANDKQEPLAWFHCYPNRFGK